MAAPMHRIQETIAEIGDESTIFHKLLTLTEWGNRPAKLDLRVWRADGDQLTPTKGITLTTEEAVELNEALTDYLNRAS